MTDNTLHGSFEEHTDRSRDVLEEFLYMNIARLEQQLEEDYQSLCERHGVTHQQYNVLRIVYVRGPVPTSYISDQLITRVPDMTRLLNRMEDKDLVDRKLSREDRRVLLVTLTSRGQSVCEDIDKELVPLMKRQFEALTGKEKEHLNQLLLKTLNGNA